MYHIISITQSEVNWNRYLQSAKQLLKRSVTSILDENRLSPDNLGSFVVTLGEIFTEETNPNEIIAHGNTLLEHVSLGFLCVLSDSLLLDIMECTNLSISSIESDVRNVRIVMVSGNLLIWQQSIINALTGLAQDEYRSLFNEFMKEFEKRKLSALWNDYYKKETLLLEKK